MAEDISGEVEVTHKMVIVIEIQDIDPEAEKARTILSQVKPIFVDELGVHVYGAVRETANAILDILKNDMTDD